MAKIESHERPARQIFEILDVDELWQAAPQTGLVYTCHLHFRELLCQLLIWIVEQNLLKKILSLVLRCYKLQELFRNLLSECQKIPMDRETTVNNTPDG
jgi:hypothetical protein